MLYDSNIALPPLDNFGQLLVPGLESRMTDFLERQMKYNAAVSLLGTIVKRNIDLFTEKDQTTAESAIARKYSFSDKSVIRLN